MRRPRSLLIMPAHRANMLEKAPQYGADALVFDLEDSVPVAERKAARELAREFIGKHKGSATIYVRVNGLQTGMLEADLDAVVVEGLSDIRLPKSESAEAVRTVDALLAALERDRGLPAGGIGICPSLESARGLWFAYEILSSSPRVRSVMCGTAENGDLQTDLGYTWTAQGQEKLCLRSRVVVAARAAGVPHLLDGAFSNVRDLESLRIDCEAARKLGFRGRSVVHPGQIETVNRIFG
jgi:citrate lyase subunit beta/citryl-CoA lyase